jgi:hypothetical protein
MLLQFNGNGELGLPTSLVGQYNASRVPVQASDKQFAAVSAGAFHVCGIEKADDGGGGPAYCWG